MLQVIKINEKLSSTFRYDILEQLQTAWKILASVKKTVFEFDYTADFLLVFCHIEYEKEGWIRKENNQMSFTNDPNKEGYWF